MGAEPLGGMDGCGARREAGRPRSRSLAAGDGRGAMGSGGAGGGMGLVETHGRE